MELSWLPIIFFLVALFYSSVGFGGGSSYLALLSIFLTEFYEVRSIALVLNIVVVSIGTFNFIRNQVFDFKSFWPFLVFSIPFAFIGAQIKLSEKVFFLILGTSLLLAGVFMVLQTIKRKIENEGELRIGKRIALGSGIGFLSGIAGIGGGIFLSPTLNLIGWKTPLKVASLASIFILVNSTSGLIGLIYSGSFVFNNKTILPLIAAAVLGGAIGSYLTNSKFNLNMIRLLTAILVTYVGLRLILLHGFGVRV